MKTTEDRAVAACHSVNPAGWRVILDEAVTRVAGRFVREPRRTAGQFVEGLLSGVERKTCWSIAERAGHDDPQAMQRLLRTAVWDADGVRDDVRAWLIEQLGHPDAADEVREAIQWCNRSRWPKIASPFAVRLKCVSASGSPSNEPPQTLTTNP
ncbi:transposase [Micromonospora tulbaghiae]|uniref:transposase n=1 Tax=Micromonospora tulbaghiae TaxID=479978 RepID=UPI00369F40BC